MGANKNPVYDEHSRQQQKKKCIGEMAAVRETMSEGYSAIERGMLPKDDDSVHDDNNNDDSAESRSSYLARFATPDQQQQQQQQQSEAATKVDEAESIGNQSYELYRSVFGRVFGARAVAPTSAQQQDLPYATSTCGTSKQLSPRELAAALSAAFAPYATQTAWLLAFVAYNGILLAALLFAIERGLEVTICQGVGLMLTLTLFVYSTMLYILVLKKHCANGIFGRNVVEDILADKTMAKYLPWITAFVLLAAVLAFLVVDSSNNRQRLISFLGVALLSLAATAWSKHRRQIHWRPVGSLLVLMFLLSLLLERGPGVRDTISCLTDKIRTMYSANGFAFFQLFYDWNKEASQQPHWPMTSGHRRDEGGGTTGAFEPFPLNLFTAMTSIYFVNFIISGLNHLGATRWLYQRVGGMFKILVGTSRAESLLAVAMVTFLGPLQAPLLLGCGVMKSVSNAELCAIMAMGMAAVQTSLFSSLQLVTVMSSLVAAKLLWPDTEGRRRLRSLNQGSRHLTRSDVRDKIHGDEKETDGILDAGLSSLSQSTSVLLNSLGLCLSLSALWHLVDFLVMFIAALFDTQTNINLLTATLLRPVCWLVGISWSECSQVSLLLAGVVGGADATLIGLSSRSAKLAAAAAGGCAKDGGLLNPIGVCLPLAVLMSLAPPSRRKDCAAVVWRAAAAAALGKLLTAAILGTVAE